MSSRNASGPNTAQSLEPQRFPVFLSHVTRHPWGGCRSNPPPDAPQDTPANVSFRGRLSRRICASRQAPGAAYCREHGRISRLGIPGPDSLCHQQNKAFLLSSDRAPNVNKKGYFVEFAKGRRTSTESGVVLLVRQWSAMRGVPLASACWFGVVRRSPPRHTCPAARRFGSVPFGSVVLRSVARHTYPAARHVSGIPGPLAFATHTPSTAARIRRRLTGARCETAEKMVVQRCVLFCPCGWRGGGFSPGGPTGIW